MAKILTDPFHDVKIYYKSPYYILQGDLYDDMSKWYGETVACAADTIDSAAEMLVSASQPITPAAAERPEINSL
jgi:hypothetical protein